MDIFDRLYAASHVINDDTVVVDVQEVNSFEGGYALDQFLLNCRDCGGLTKVTYYLNGVYAHTAAI